MRNKILVITNTKEPSVAEVLRNLKSFGETSIRLNTDNFLDNVLELPHRLKKSLGN